MQHCARCWSLWTDHQAFLAADPTGLDPADLADADRRLSPIPRRRPVPRPARWLAIAAALVVMASVGVWQLVPREPRHVLRGGDPTPTWDVEVVVGSTRIEVVWTPIAGIDGYRVVFFDTALVELAQQETVESSLSIPRGFTPSAAFLRVQALRLGDVVSQSDLRALE